MGRNNWPLTQTPERGDLKVQFAALKVLYTRAADVFQRPSIVAILDGVHVSEILLPADAFAFLEGIFLHRYYAPLVHRTEEVVSL